MVKPVAFAGLLPLLMGSAAVAQTVPVSPYAAGQNAGNQAGQNQDAADASVIPDVVVTASKQGSQALQKTPIAVSVVDTALLESQSLTNIKDIATYVPNLAVSRNVSGSIISIRGIGSNGGDSPSVTTQVDGVYIANSTAFTDFFDVARVEVLRGPQGTLYGRNATGGVINFISRQPSSDFEGKVRVGYGNYNAVEASAYISGPISSTLKASLALDHRDHDGYFHNIVPGGHDVGTGGNEGARFQLRWEPSANIDATTRADYSEANQRFESYDHLLTPVAFNAPLANSLVGSYRDVAIDGDQTLRVRDRGVSEDINWRLGQHFSVNSITAYRKNTSIAFNDNDATDLNLLYFRSTGDSRQLSQELNLKYASDRLNGVFGAFYFDGKSLPGSYVQQPASVVTPAARAVARGAFPTQGTQSFAVFGQVEYEIFPNLKAIVGARYTTEKNSFDQNFQTTSLNPATLGVSAVGFPIVFSTSRRDDAFTPKFGLNLQAADNVFLYASATRGFKSGGFNGQATSAATAGFAPETIWSYEVGAKTDWLDRRLRLNLTGFYYDYTNLQVRQLLGPGVSVIANAASATVKGVELEAVGKPAHDLQLSGSLSYLDAKYDSFPAAAIPSAFSAYVPNQNCVAGVCTINVSGNRLSDAPKWSGLIALDYSPAIGSYQVNFHVDESFRSSRYFDLSNIPLSRQGAYALLNANVGFGPRGEKGWRIEVFGRNLTNKNYYQTISGNGVAPGAIVGDPRTYGVRGSFAW